MSPLQDGLDYIQSELHRVKFIDAQLNEVKITQAIATEIDPETGMGADFSGANLTDANLSGSQLPFGDFSNTVLERTDFSDSDLQGATFSSTELQVIYNSQTICPDGRKSFHNYQCNNLFNPPCASSQIGCPDIEWISIQGSSFSMGSNENLNEQPIHRVNVLSFEMMKTEVTVGMYRACVNAGVCTTPQEYDEVNSDRFFALHLTPTGQICQRQKKIIL